MRIMETERKTISGKWKQKSGESLVSKTVERLNSPSESSDKGRVSPFT